MKRVFDLDGPLLGFLGRIADFFILNIIFMITCIPIVTIGPALTALYTITLKMVKNEEAYIFKSYFVAFKENFKISFLTGLLLLVALIILGFDYRIVTASGGDMGAFFQILFLALIFICLVVGLYVFPYIARFENGLKASFKNAVLIAIASLPWTLALVALTGGAVVVSIFVIPLQYTILIWFLVGFALLAYGQSFVFRQVFAKYEPKEDAEEEQEQD